MGLEESGSPENKGGKISDWASVVPEATYDLLGRVAPGIIVVVAAIWLYTGNAFSPPLSFSSWFADVLIIVVGYVFGLSGDVAADATIDRLLAWIYGAAFSFWRHFEHVSSAKQKVLQKMWAERLCLWNLFLGWLCIGVARPLAYKTLSITMRLMVGLILFGLFIRWDWTCRARARTLAEGWKRSFGSFRVRGDSH